MLHKFSKMIYHLLLIIWKNLFYTYRYLCQRIKIEKYSLPSVVYELLITHDGGGGTENYVSNYIKNRKDIVVLRNISYGRDILFSVEDYNLDISMYIKPDQMVAFLESINASIITVNSLVRNFSSKKIIDILNKKRIMQNVIIKYNVHDYHCICPNHKLIIYDKYCNLECHSQKCHFDKIVVSKNITIDAWREQWRFFLSVVASEIICFSQSTEEYMQKIYPDIARKITVVPHSMAYCKFTPVNITSYDFHVGIIGGISSRAKGLSVIKKFLRLASAKKIKVSVVGKMFFWDKVYSPYINYHGPYKNEELQGIIEQRKITNILFPSIVPETFSYLISELMAMNIPIVCFNIGAQAEKVKNYNRGSICKSTSAEDILLTLKSQYIDLVKKKE